MLEKAIAELYEKLTLHFYRSIYDGFATQESSLTASETFFTEVIHALDRPTIKEVSEFLNVTQPNITYKVNKLVKKGYIDRIPSKADKREVYLEVTDKFFEYYNVKTAYLKLVISRAKQYFPDEDLEHFEYMLHTISAELMPEITNEIKRGHIRL